MSVRYIGAAPARSDDPVMNLHMVENLCALHSIKMEGLYNGPPKWQCIGYVISLPWAQMEIPFGKTLDYWRGAVDGLVEQSKKFNR